MLSLSFKFAQELRFVDEAAAEGGDKIEVCFFLQLQCKPNVCMQQEQGVVSSGSLVAEKTHADQFVRFVLG